MKEESIEKKDEKQILSDELYKEVQEYYKIAKEYRRNKYNSRDETEVYIIEKNFIKKWKQYILYSETKRDIQLSTYNYNFKKCNLFMNPEFFPGEINNNSLLVSRENYYNDGNDEDLENFVIQSDLSQRKDFKYVNYELWSLFYNKYKGGPVLKKIYVEEGGRNSYSRKIIEIFYKKFNVVFLKDRKEFNEDYIENLSSKPLYISKVKNLSDLKLKILRIYNHITQKSMVVKNIRLWKINCGLLDIKDFLKRNLSELINSTILFDLNELNYLEYLPDIALSDLDFSEEDICLVEISNNSEFLLEVKKIEMKEENCEWCRNRKLCRYPCICKDVWYCTQTCKERDMRFHEDKCKKKWEIEDVTLKKIESSKLGIVGLSNLGNTCFMNTALQCISNCWELTEYFLNGNFRNHLNIDNPIGSQGILARAYANLLANMWYGTSSTFSPFIFKRAIEGFQTMFSGFQQHDTQEFLNYLLDGLHEDLNKVLKKPLVEKDESKKSDHIKSRDSWIGFLRRNQSILVDLLYGQYKSTLYCPNDSCQNISTTFDPFLSVSLPLISKSQPYFIEFYLIFYDTNVLPIKLRIPFATECTIMAFRNKVAQLLKIHPFSFLIGKLENGNFENFISSSNLLSKGYGNERTLFLMQIDPSLFYSHSNHYFDGKYQSRDYKNLSNEVREDKDLLEKIFNEDYEEVEEGKTSETICYYSRNYTGNLSNAANPAAPYIGPSVTEDFKINVDNNYGFGSDFLKIMLFLKSYDDYSSSCRRRIIFPRIIYINKKWTTLDVHLKVFEFFLPVLEKFEKKQNSTYAHKYEDASNFDKFNYFFNNLDSSINNDDVKFQIHAGYPYRIRIKNINSISYDNCYFCGRQRCEDCLLPYNKNLTIDDIIEKIPKNDGLVIDNTFLFLKDSQKFHAIKNKDFSFEITFLSKYHEPVKELNEFDDLSFSAFKSSGSKSIKIDDCFKLFVKMEKLKENNEWFCASCKEFTKATKKMEIYRAPHILVIHLKRFSSNNKIDTLVDFPLVDLNLSEYILSQNENEDLKYDLFAISNHFGGLGGGHYIAYAKNHILNKWFKFDDSSVYEMSENDLVTSSAYVLFYRKRNPVDLQQLYMKSFENYENVDNVNSNQMNNIEIDHTNPNHNMEIDCEVNVQPNVIQEENKDNPS